MNSRHDLKGIFKYRIKQSWPWVENKFIYLMHVQRKYLFFFIYSKWVSKEIWFLIPKETNIQKTFTLNSALLSAFFNNCNRNMALFLGQRPWVVPHCLAWKDIHTMKTSNIGPDLQFIKANEFNIRIFNEIHTKCKAIKFFHPLFSIWPSNLQ